MLNDWEQRACSVLAERAGETAALLAELVRLPSLNPPGNTQDCARAVAARLSSFCSEVEVVAALADRPNVLARLGSGRGPRLVLCSHLDTVPPGDESAWACPPFGAEIRDGRLYGRGAADAKSAVAAMVMAAEVLAPLDLFLAGTLQLALVSDEEVGGRHGTRYLVERGRLDADLAVIGETTQNRLATAERGLVRFQVTTYGRASHASTPRAGINAIDKMVDLLLALRTDLEPRLTERVHPLLPSPSLVVGTIGGGITSNVVPDRCTVELDRRTLPSEDHEQARAEIAAIIAERERADPDFRASLEANSSGIAFETPPGSPLVETTRQALRDLGLPDEPVGYQQASDGKRFAARGIPTIMLGPGDPAVAHGAQEQVELSEVVRAAQIYAVLALRLLKPVG